MSDDTKAIVDCCECGKKMRVPSDRGLITFKCPGCGTQLDWAPVATIDKVEVVPTEPDKSKESIAPRQAVPATLEKDNTNPWGDILLAVILALITLFLIGAFDLTSNDTSFYIILSIGGFLTVFSLASGIKGLVTDLLDKLRAHKSAKSKSTLAPEHGSWRARTHFFVAALIVVSLNIAIPVLDGMSDSAVEIIGGIVIAGLAGQCIYSVFRGIRLAFAKGMGASIAMTIGAFYLISMIPEALRLVNLDLTAGIALFESEPENSHFRGVKVENTSPSDLDDLMEDWE